MQQFLLFIRMEMLDLAVGLHLNNTYCTSSTACHLNLDRTFQNSALKARLPPFPSKPLQPEQRMKGVCRQEEKRRHYNLQNGEGAKRRRGGIRGRIRGGDILISPE